MLIKSALITQASGSVGGLTASRNRGGAYFRARSIPVNPDTPQQQAVRNAMSTLVGAWSNTLTFAQREGWRAYAESTPVTNALGDEITLSGINMFTGANVPRLQAGLAQVNDRPGPNNFGTAPTITLASASAASQNVSVGFDAPEDWVDQDGAGLLVSFSRPVNAGVSFFKGPYRLAAVVLGNATTAPTSPVTASFPFAMSEGSVLHAQARISLSDGRLSPVFRDTITVGA